MKNDLAFLMEENLTLVWSVRSASNRMKSIKKIYNAESILYHVGHQTTGYDAINNRVSNILTDVPEEFIFFKLKPVFIKNNIGWLIWGMGPDLKSLVTTGMDIAVFEDGKIKYYMYSGLIIKNENFLKTRIT